MPSRPIDPRICNIGLYANALDQDGTGRDHLIDRFCALSADRVITIVVAAGVRGEVVNPRTPSSVRDVVLPQIFNLRPGLNASQRRDRGQARDILEGNARRGKHAADASHLSEAAETGCGYFITHDQRILDRRRELARVLRSSLTIVTLTEFFEIFNHYEAGRRR